MIILIGSQKGGCGKSTTAVNICAGLAARGFDVVLVDADRQSTGANWAQDRAENAALPVVHCVQRYDAINSALRDLNSRYGVVVVDCAGRDSKELRTGMVVADVLIVPFRPSQVDLDTLPNLCEIIGAARDLNPSLAVFGLLTMAPTNPVIKERGEASDYLRDYPQITLLKTVLHDRKIYRDAMSEGRGVIEMGNEKAAAEINALLAEVYCGD
jgi:chromosome partitioning protein